MTLPLADVRIISIEQYGAGPYATMHLADLGAQVVKIEQPGDGDVGRFVPPYQAEGDSLFFQSFNRNKLSIGLDIASPAGRAVFEDLVQRADAVFSNMRGDVPAKLRIRYADLAHLNPAIVCCSLSGYGMSGPRAAEPGFDYMVQGRAGWMSLTGDPSGPPTKTGLSVVDFSSGLAAALAMMVAIYAARREGVGCDCDVSLLDTAISMLSYIATWTATSGYRPGKVAQSGHPTLVPFGNFPTADGWIVAGGSKEKFWRRLAHAIGLPELTEDPRLRTFGDRLAHRDLLQGLLNATFRTRPTAEWVEILSTAGVPCAPVNSVPEALADEQVIARGMVEYLDHERFGRVAHVRSPVRVGDSRRTLNAAPSRGAHTEEVLAGLLRYTPDQIADLAAAGVIELHDLSLDEHPD
jgi:crotonobetainyl-CoA:carnitine CoA-transferase CaiB-like acyl-CoA transferase